MRSILSAQSIIALSLMGALVMGCSNRDNDDDGLSNGEEKELGTDPESKDSDGDGIEDGDEVDLGLDPVNADTDGDGLADGAELENNTDPLDDDSDDDGYADGLEINEGTNPNYAYSHSYTGGYSVGWCDTPPVATGPTGEASFTHQGTTYEWTAYQAGDVAENFQLMDQHGEMVDLYSFCGQYVHIEFGAFW
jgi:hypothetical protein